MNYENGTFKILYIKKNDIFVPVGCLTSNSFSETADMLDTTTRDNAGWKTATPTSQGYNISFDGLITQELTLSNLITYTEIKELKRNRTLIEWKIEDSTGNSEKGSAHINNLSDSAEIDAMTVFSGSLIGFGIVLNIVDDIFAEYNARVTAASGTITSETCQKLFITKLLGI